MIRVKHMNKQKLYKLKKKRQVTYSCTRKLIGHYNDNTLASSTLDP